MFTVLLWCIASFVVCYALYAMNKAASYGESVEKKGCVTVKGELTIE